MDDYRKSPTFDTYGEIDMVSNQTYHSEIPGDCSHDQRQRNNPVRPSPLMPESGRDK